MMLIKTWNISDLESLRAISVSTFLETFSDFNSQEDMQSYVQNRLNTTELKQELENGNSIFWGFYVEEQCIGYAKMNVLDAQKEYQKSDEMEIERFYLLNEYHGKGFAQQAMNRIFDFAKLNMKVSIWLGVWEKNVRAISFYHKQGFREVDSHVFELGSDLQRDLIMKIVL